MRVVLADDHAMFRQGLRMLLEREDIEVAAEAADGRDALQVVREIRPDAAVLDLSMPGMDGLEVARELRRIVPGVRTILLTMHEEEAFVLEAMRAGASGYVLKAQAAADVVEAIRQVVQGAIYLSPGVSETVVRAYARRADESESSPDLLSARERQVLRLIADGRTTGDIARVLGVSAKTVASHRARIMKKLRVHNVAELVRHAIRRGLLLP